MRIRIILYFSIILMMFGGISSLNSVVAKEDISATPNAEKCSGPGDTFKITILLNADEDGHYKIQMSDRVNIFDFVVPKDGEDNLEMLEGDSVEFYFELKANDSIREGKYIIEYTVSRDKKVVIDDGKIEVIVEIKEESSFIPGFEIIPVIISLIIIIKFKKYSL